MAPQEVAGLQALAMKHGGSLTINPETGLPEAGFLSTILPMVAGFALGPAGFGLMSSAMAGITVGGISALTSGSLSKGLMAGLGAYGGAGLGESLMGAGTGSLSSAAGAGAPQVAAESIVPQAAMPAATNAAATNVAATNVAAAAPDVFGGTANEIASAYGYPTLAAPTVPAINAAQIVPTVTQAPVAASVYAPAESMGAALARDQAAAQAVGSKLASTGAADTLGAGFKAITASPSAALEFAKANKMTLGALGISALAGMQPDDLNAPEQNPGMIRPYTYARTKNKEAFEDVEGTPLSSKERRYFNDAYTALTPYKAPGAEYMAEGGPVEDMSNANAIGMNTGYPQSDIRAGAYATPYQQPISRNVVTGAQDAAVNPYTGQPQFAEGGSVGGYTYDPETGIYTKKGGTGATTVSPIGGISGASGSSDMQPMDPKTLEFLEKETPAERESRMLGINSLLQNAVNFAVPGVGFVNSLPGMLSSATAGQIANFFNPPGAVNYDIPVVDAVPTFYTPEGRYGFTAEQPGTPSPDSGGGNQSGNSETGGQGTGDGGAGSGGGRSAGDARGGFYNNGKFDQRPANMAQGGISNLGDYSDGGRLLRGPGDGVSDDIPAMIGQKQQARLADGEFVVPARIVSELGNGSTEAGARQLYAMMDRVQKARKKTVGKDKVATNSRAAKLLPA
jgi:hypothetical protein